MRAKTIFLFLTLFPAMSLVRLRAEVEFLPDDRARTFFAGENRPVAVKIRNPSDQPVEMDLRTQIYQASSATTIAIAAPKYWKKLQLPARQTVLETTPLTFPPVKNETRFLVEWLNEKNNVVGKTDVKIYPANLLLALRPLCGAKPPGIFDPENQLKPLLKASALEFDDLEEGRLDSFSGALAIIGPFQSRLRLNPDLSAEIQALSKKGTPVVWIQPPKKRWPKLQPSYYIVPQKKVATVIVQAGLVADLAENPAAQLNLIYFCQLAVHPQAPTLPAQ
jgi:hypothetical protein